MIGLTPKLAKLLDYLTIYPSASLYEICDHMGWSRASKSYAHYALRRLEERGWIKVVEGSHSRRHHIEVLHRRPPRLRVVYDASHFEWLARMKRAEYRNERGQHTPVS